MWNTLQLQFWMESSLHGAHWSCQQVIATISNTDTKLYILSKKPNCQLAPCQNECFNWQSYLSSQRLSNQSTIEFSTTTENLINIHIMNLINLPQTNYNQKNGHCHILVSQRFQKNIYCQVALSKINTCHCYYYEHISLNIRLEIFALVLILTSYPFDSQTPWETPINYTHVLNSNSRRLLRSVFHKLRNFEFRLTEI